MNKDALSYNASVHSRLLSLCKPLVEKGITTFARHQYFKNGRILRLSTNLPWSDFYFEKEFFNDPRGYVHDIVATGKKDYTMIPWGVGQPNKGDTFHALHDFDIWNGIALSTRQEDSIVAYSFGGTRENVGINQFYEDNPHFLKNFILYFQEKAKDILDVKNPRKLIHTDFAQILPNGSSHTKSVNYGAQNCFKDLADREYECLFYLARGKSSREIGELLTLSTRTVESYLNKAKSKLNISSKSDLIEFFLNGSALKEKPLPQAQTVQPLLKSMGLTERERECLFYLARGKTLRETANIMDLSKRTVEFYIQNIKKTQGISRRSELIECFLDKSNLILNQ